MLPSRRTSSFAPRAFLLSTLLALLSAVAVARDLPPPVQEDSSPPAVLALRDLSGAPASLESFRGRIVVLNFWATWCVPCREEMPLLVRLRREYATRGVEVIGASADDESTQPQIAPFLRKLQIDFPIWVGATTAHMERLGLGAALPATAILDPDGRIAFRILGPLEEPDLRARLDWLLGSGGSPPPPSLSTFEKHAAEHPNDHAHAEDEAEHQHGGVGMEGASLVPS